MSKLISRMNVVFCGKMMKSLKHIPEGTYQAYPAPIRNFALSARLHVEDTIRRPRASRSFRAPGPVFVQKSLFLNSHCLAKIYSIKQQKEVWSTRVQRPSFPFQSNAGRVGHDLMEYEFIWKHNSLEYSAAASEAARSNESPIRSLQPAAAPLASWTWVCGCARQAPDHLHLVARHHLSRQQRQWGHGKADSGGHQSLLTDGFRYDVSEIERIGLTSSMIDAGSSYVLTVGTANNSFNEPICRLGR